MFTALIIYLTGYVAFFFMYIYGMQVEDKGLTIDSILIGVFCSILWPGIILNVLYNIFPIWKNN